MQTDFVFLHGGGQGSWVWSQTIAALEQQTSGGFGRALALDIPGCGSKRSRATDNLDVSSIVSELLEEIQEAGCNDVVLVGHSQAGTILPLLIEAQPRLFRRVVYVSCVAPLRGETVLNWRFSMPAGNSALATAPPPGTRDRYRQMFCNDMDPESAERFLDQLGPDRWPSCSYEVSEWRYDHLDELPGTYILCLRDEVLIPSWQQIFAERLKVKRLINVDAGHQVMNTRPQALAELLRLEAAADK
jgi:pimeloyl-ACP methyl ester carboxylesterase